LKRRKTASQLTRARALAQGNLYKRQPEPRAIATCRHASAIQCRLGECLNGPSPAPGNLCQQNTLTLAPLCGGFSLGAALALTRLDCVDPDQLPLARRRLDEWRAQVLDAVDASALPGYLKNRVLMRRAAVWGSLAFAQARNGETADAAATRALAELAGVNKNELTDDDVHKYTDAAMRVSASRWAAETAVAAPSFRNVAVTTAAGEPGETCLSLVAAKSDAKTPQAALAKRCTYGIVWANSATMNREGTALAIAVQQTATWRELWIFKKSGGGWTVSVLPPAAFSPDVGYAEFAGWVPGGKQILVAREAKGDGKYNKSFEVAQLDTLAVERQARDASLLNAFQRWQDPSWKRQTLSLR